MANIKKVLLNRVYAWEQAIKIADSPEFWKMELGVSGEQKEEFEVCIPLLLRLTLSPSLLRNAKFRTEQLLLIVSSPCYRSGLKRKTIY